LSPEQQPLQELVVQVHLPETHPCVELHASHAAPPVPQAAVVFPVWHVSLLSQQPPGQLVASQVAVLALHVPALQISLSLQAVQVTPPVPQLASLLPGAQLPLLSQQPLQVLGPHATDLHCLLRHFSPFLQLTQAMPPVPHTAGFVPGRQAWL
jgi:hypothetical protein